MSSNQSHQEKCNRQICDNDLSFFSFPSQNFIELKKVYFSSTSKRLCVQYHAMYGDSINCSGDCVGVLKDMIWCFGYCPLEEV